MKYDLMLIGPATRDINIDYTGQEVREIGGAVFFCAYAAAAASANLSLQSRSIRTIPMYWMHFIWTATISPCCPPNAPP